VGSAANTINIAISGAVGDRALGAADKLTFTTDHGVGTAASPNLSYGTWSISADSPAYLQLQQGGVGGATTLKFSGAGSFVIGADSPADWQNLTTIDASGSGGVLILGATSFLGTTLPVAFSLNPGGLFGSAAGLLSDNTSLTQFIGSSTGSNIIDVSSFTTTAQLAALTATGNTVVTNQIIVRGTLVDATSPATWAGISNFQQIDDWQPTGTIDIANLPAATRTIEYLSPALGAISINNQKSFLIVDTEQNGAAENLTVGAVGPPPALNDVFVLDVGNVYYGAAGAVGDVTINGDETVRLFSNGRWTHGSQAQF
jgi:hypothetical protein